jgi:hypothetical protein
VHSASLDTPTVREAVRSDSNHPLSVSSSLLCGYKALVSSAGAANPRIGCLLATGRRETDLIRLPASIASEPRLLSTLKASTNYRKLPDKLSWWLAVNTYKSNVKSDFKKTKSGDEDIIS